jgi:hypothetical protein
VLQQRLPDIFEDAERLIFPVLCQLLYSLNERPLTAEHSRNHDSVDVFNNQQRVLLFSNKIKEEVCLASIFDTSNTVSKIDEECLSVYNKTQGF